MLVAVGLAILAVGNSLSFLWLMDAASNASSAGGMGAAILLIAVLGFNGFLTLVGLGGALALCWKALTAPRPYGKVAATLACASLVLVVSVVYTKFRSLDDTAKRNHPRNYPLPPTQR